MTNTQVQVHTHGTTTLATAGKYCDRNIDVCVEPPRFTNLYDPAGVTVDHKITVSNNVVSRTANSEVNILKIPFHHLPGEPFVLRLRGLSTVRSNLVAVLLGKDGETRVTHFYTSDPGCCTLTYDGYGDAVLTLTGSLVNLEWYTLELNVQYVGQASAETSLTGPIVTVNEAIGDSPRHFSAVIEGTGEDTLSFYVPFEPDLISVTGYDPTVLLEENNAMQLIYDLRSFGLMGGMVLISKVNSSKLAALTSVSAATRYSREENGTVTIQNIKDAAMTSGGIFRTNVMYSVSAVKYTDKTDRQRITEMVQRLTGKGSLTVNRAKVNAAFTDEEWAALIAQKPGWTFAFIG